MGINTTLSERITTLLEKKEITIKQLSKDININYSTLDNYIIGDRSMPLEVLVKISNYFNVTTDYLLGISEFAPTDNVKRTIYNNTSLDEDNIDNLKKLVNMRIKNVTTICDNLIESPTTLEMNKAMNGWLDFFFKNINIITEAQINRRLNAECGLNDYNETIEKPTNAEIFKFANSILKP